MNEDIGICKAVTGLNESQLAIFDPSASHSREIFKRCEDGQWSIDRNEIASQVCSSMFEFPSAVCLMLCEMLSPHPVRTNFLKSLRQFEDAEVFDGKVLDDAMHHGFECANMVDFLSQYPGYMDDNNRNRLLPLAFLRYFGLSLLLLRCLDSGKYDGNYDFMMPPGKTNIEIDFLSPINLYVRAIMHGIAKEFSCSFLDKYDELKRNNPAASDSDMANQQVSWFLFDKVQTETGEVFGVRLFSSCACDFELVPTLMLDEKLATIFLTYFNETGDEITIQEILRNMMTTEDEIKTVSYTHLRRRRCIVT